MAAHSAGTLAPGPPRATASPVPRQGPGRRALGAGPCRGHGRRRRLGRAGPTHSLSRTCRPGSPGAPAAGLPSGLRSHAGGNTYLQVRVSLRHRPGSELTSASQAVRPEMLARLREVASFRQLRMKQCRRGQCPLAALCSDAASAQCALSRRRAAAAAAAPPTLCGGHGRAAAGPCGAKARLRRAVRALPPKGGGSGGGPCRRAAAGPGGGGPLRRRGPAAACHFSTARRSLEGLPGLPGVGRAGGEVPPPSARRRWSPARRDRRVA
jgi:hypothetical protein